MTTRYAVLILLGLGGCFADAHEANGGGPEGLSIAEPPEREQQQQGEEEEGGGGEEEEGGCGVEHSTPPDEPLPPVDVAGVCGDGGYAPSFLDTPVPGDRGVHVIGVYEGWYGGGSPHGFDYHPQGAVDVYVHDTGRPITLVLNSYEPVEWRLHVDEGAIVQEVALYGYHEQTVSGAPDGAAISSSSYEGNGQYVDCVYGWEPENNTGGCSYETFVSHTREAYGEESSFAGCYAGRAFHVGA